MDMQKLAQLLRLRESPPQPQLPPQTMPQLGGMSGQAQNILQMRPAYMNYVEQTQSNGGQPLPFEAWLVQQPR